MIYEYRIYRAVPGKLEAVQDRFLTHTLRFFAQHGIRVTAIFRPKGIEHELHYMTCFDSVEARDAASSWRRAVRSFLATAEIARSVPRRRAGATALARRLHASRPHTLNNAEGARDEHR